MACCAVRRGNESVVHRQRPSDTIQFSMTWKAVEDTRIPNDRSGVVGDYEVPMTWKMRLEMVTSTMSWRMPLEVH